MPVGSVESQEVRSKSGINVQRRIMFGLYAVREKMPGESDNVTGKIFMADRVVSKKRISESPLSSFREIFYSE